MQILLYDCALYMGTNGSMTNTTSSFTIKGNVLQGNAVPAGLYLVSTPIGNLGDITLRALETLAGCTVIACEDTRSSGVLLSRYGIDRPKISYNEHNADRRGPDILRQIGEGAAVALISDAGTPLVNDPGFRLVVEAVEVGINVVPIPGASAPLSALVASGLKSEDFRFCGFIPNKAGARSKWLNKLADAPSTLIFFEAPTRLIASLKSMVETFGSDRPAVVARELTKMYETFERGTLSELVKLFEGQDRLRGEFVIVVEGSTETSVSELDASELLKDALTRLKTKDAAAEVAEQTGLPRQDLYRQALDLKKNG